MTEYYSGFRSPQLDWVRTWRNDTQEIKAQAIWDFDVVRLLEDECRRVLEGPKRWTDVRANGLVGL